MSKIKSLLFLTALFLCLAAFAVEKKPKPVRDDRGEIRVIQISDLHIGLSAHPEGVPHTQQAIETINRLHPDLVLVSGDLSENKPDARAQVRELLKGLQVAYKSVPGNHDVHDDDMNAYRAAFGNDYYSFDLKGFRFIGLNSQLMGNFDNFEAKQTPRNGGKAAQESDNMFRWLESLKEDKDKPTFVFQHIPITRENAPDNKPYWGVSDPYLGREIEQLKRLHVKHMFAGHWHNPQTLEVQGIKVHVAPAVNYGIKTDQVGMMMYTIDRSGNVKEQLIPLDMAQ
jgi:3',5'-cyclic AMP phosphodiesterase CpdA